MNAPLLALFATLAAAIGSMRVWWLHAQRMESRYIWDYIRLTLGMPSYRLWPYRIEAVQHRPITDIPYAVYDGRPLWLVLLWPLLATVAVGILAMLLASVFADGSNNEQGRVIRGPRLVSHRQFNLRTIFKRKGAFYIETK